MCKRRAQLADAAPLLRIHQFCVMAAIVADETSGVAVFGSSASRALVEQSHLSKADAENVAD
jgi:hypothetical protein